MAADCDARIAVLDGARELARWQPVLARLPGLKKIIVRDAAACPAGDQYLTWADLSALGRHRLAAEPGAVAGPGGGDQARVTRVTVLYTSGTTGNPKGVIITHRSVLYELAAADATGFVMERVRWVSYLPLAHIAERMFTIYGPMSQRRARPLLPQRRRAGRPRSARCSPTAFFGVPRVWEKIQAGIQALLAAEQDPAKRAAVDAGHGDRPQVRDSSCEFGNTTPDDLAGEFRRADEQVLRPIRSCSAWARRPRCPARRRRCRRTWPPSSPGWA